MNKKKLCFCTCVEKIATQRKLKKPENSFKTYRYQEFHHHQYLCLHLLHQEHHRHHHRYHVNQECHHCHHRYHLKKFLKLSIFSFKKFLFCTYQHREFRHRQNRVLWPQQPQQKRPFEGKVSRERGTTTSFLILKQIFLSIENRRKMKVLLL